MRRILSAAALCASIAALSWGCGLFQQAPSATLELELRLHDALSSRAASPDPRRSIVPGEPWLPHSYRVSGTGPGGIAFVLEGEEPVLRQNLVPGPWSVLAEALAPNGKTVAAVEASFVLEPSRRTSARLLLAPPAGAGSLHLAFETNFPAAAGGSYAGSLTYFGLPGSPTAPSQPPLEFLVPDSSPQIGYESLAAGQYALALRYLDSSGNFAGGCAETLLVLKDFDTTGSCVVELGQPELSVEAGVVEYSPLGPPLQSAPCIVADLQAFLPIARPLLRPAGAPASTKTWCVVGAETLQASSVTKAPADLFPDGLFVMAQPPSTIFGLNRVRYDFMELCAAEARAGSSSTWAEAREGPASSGGFAWIASFDCNALKVPGLASAQAAILSPGRSAVRAVASAPSGLVALAGLDEDSSIHLFAAAYGASVPGQPGPGKLPLSSPWIRIWKDKIKVGSSYRTADRLAMSRDGRYLAAASSASNWLRLYSLGEEGAILRIADLTGAAQGLGGLDGVKALAFTDDSPDPQLLALCSGSKSVLVFDCGAAEPVLAGGMQLEQASFQGALSLQDLEILPGGTALASASEASKVYILGREGSAWSLKGSLTGAELRKPGPMAASPSSPGFYVLCDKSSLLRYEPAGAWTFSLAQSIPLSSRSAGALTLAAGRDEAGSRDLLFAAGGGAAAFLDPGRAGSPDLETELLPSPSGVDGIASAEGSCFLRGAFLLAGGSSCLAAVFGPR